MAFIRRRRSSNHRDYGELYSHQLIETYRQDGKVKQRVIANLRRCETVEEALEVEREWLEDYRKDVARGVPIFGWRDTRSWRRLGHEGQEREKTKWREYIASRVAYHEARVATLESVVSKKTTGVKS
jgi:hypothetical protein